MQESQNFKIGDSVRYIFDGCQYMIVGTKTDPYKASWREIFPEGLADYVLVKIENPMPEFSTLHHFQKEMVEPWKD